MEKSGCRPFPMCWAKGIFTFAKGVSSVFQNLLQTDLQLVENGKRGGEEIAIVV